MKLDALLANDDLPPKIKAALSDPATSNIIKAKMIKVARRGKNNPLPSKKTKMNSFIDTFGNLGDDDATTDQGRMVSPDAR